VWNWNLGITVGPRSLRKRDNGANVVGRLAEEVKVFRQKFMSNI